MKQSRILDSAIFDQVAAVIGSGDAAKLCDRLGGTCIYVPASVGTNHPITLAIGAAAAKLLCEHFTGEQLQLPKAWHRKRRVLELAAQQDPKLTLAEIALATDYSQRHVIRILADSKEDDGQLDLFADL